MRVIRAFVTEAVFYLLQSDNHVSEVDPSIEEAKKDAAQREEQKKAAEEMKKKAEEAIQLKKGGKNSDEKKEDSSKEEVKEEPAAAADNRIVPEGVIPDEALEGAKKQDVPPAPEEPGKTKRKLKIDF